jgi:hypothetical protein
LIGELLDLHCKYISLTFFLFILSDGSEHGKVLLTEYGCYGPIAQTLPPLVIGTVVQCINMPLVRATITIQNPTCELKTVGSALHFIYTTRGIEGRYCRNAFLLIGCEKLLAVQPTFQRDFSAYLSATIIYCFSPQACGTEFLQEF